MVRKQVGRMQAAEMCVNPVGMESPWRVREAGENHMAGIKRTAMPEVSLEMEADPAKLCRIS